MTGLVGLLRFDRLRHHFVRLRYRLLRQRLRFAEVQSRQIGDDTLRHNLAALDSPSAFGCGGRMGLLIHPLVGYYSFFRIDRPSLRILLVGTRTEDDIYWARAYGFSGAMGFDLFSYSGNTLVGDIHATGFDDGTFDAVILGWMLSYTKDPVQVLRECRRIVKPGGLIGVGIEHDPRQQGDAIEPPRANPINDASGLLAAMAEATAYQLIFQYDHCNDASGDYGTAVIVRCPEAGDQRNAS